jgi:hypothetical protein
MGYVLKRESEAEFARRAPNHPFAHDQISFVSNPELSSSSLSAQPVSEQNSAEPDPMQPAADAIEAWLKQGAGLLNTDKPPKDR